MRRHMHTNKEKKIKDPPSPLISNDMRTQSHLNWLNIKSLCCNIRTSLFYKQIKRIFFPHEAWEFRERPEER